MELTVYKKDGSRADTRQVADEAFGTQIKKALLKQYVDMYRANQRLGSAATRERSQIRGSRRKPYRQKGTGNARAGSRQSPIWRSGGTVFGPRPRDFSYSIPKAAKREALRSALLSKFKDGEVLVIEELAFDKPATRKAAQIFAALGIEKSCLVVVPELDRNLYKSVRNIQGADVMPISDLNAYDVVAHRNLLVTAAALTQLEEAF